MRDSYFNVPPAKQSRLLGAFQRGADGSLALQPRPPLTAVTFFSGGGGLSSTASDYVRFVRALLGGGELDGRRVLSAKLTAMMGSNQIGGLTLRPMKSVIPQLATDNSSAVLPGMPDKFGLGSRSTARRQRAAVA